MKKILTLLCAFCLLVPFAAAGAAAEARLGDANGDGEITAADARLVLRVSVGLDEAGENADRMDADGDRTIAAADARLVLRRAVGLIKRFPPETPLPVPRETDALTVAVEAPRAVFYAVESNVILYRKGLDERAAPASTIKLLTALTALKYCAPDKVFTAGDEIDLIAEDSSLCELEKGMQFTLKQLLYGMLLPSGNDAAYCIAANVARTVKNCADPKEAVAYFASLMNETAWEIGMDDTFVVSPDGYDAPEQHTTARDMLTLARTVLGNELILQVCSATSVTFPLTYEPGKEPAKQKDRDKEKDAEEEEEEEEQKTEITWRNTNRFLNPSDKLYDERAYGLKGGFTDDAGCCLVAAFRSGGKNYIAIVLGAESFTERFETAAAMMNAAAERQEEKLSPQASRALP